MRRLPRFLVVALTVGLAGLGRAPAAHADESAAAVSLFDEGNRLYEAGNFAEACPKYEASLRLDASSIDTRGRLALCYEKTGRLASAWTAWREVRSRASRSLGRERAVDIAVAHISELEPKLARLTLQPAAGAPPGLSVTLDGASFPVESFGVPVAVDKGTHRIEASAPGHDAWSGEIAIVDGDKKSFEVGPLKKSPVAATPPPGPDASAGAPLPLGPPQPRERPSQARKWIGITTLALGVVALGVGTVEGLDAMTKRDDAVKAGCDDNLAHCDNVAARETAQNAYDTANLSTGFFIGGGALALTGIILWATAPSAADVPERSAWHITPTVSPRSAGVAFTGSF